MTYYKVTSIALTKEQKTELKNKSIAAGYKSISEMIRQEFKLTPAKKEEEIAKKIEEKNDSETEVVYS